MDDVWLMITMCDGYDNSALKEPARKTSRPSSHTNLGVEL